MKNITVDEIVEFLDNLSDRPPNEWNKRASAICGVLKEYVDQESEMIAGFLDDIGPEWEPSDDEEPDTSSPRQIGAYYGAP